MSKFILEVKNMTKHFDGVRAVDGLSVTVEKGKITGIIGPNGSGKSTLVNLLSGMIENDGGVFIIQGETIERMKGYEVSSYGITRTFQEVRLFNQMTVLDNVLVVLTKRSPVAAMFESHDKFYSGRAKDILEKVGIWEKRNELAANLSYGQRKLLEIARALAVSMTDGEPDIFLFDEPFAGLFSHMVKTVEGILLELRNEGKTIILVEHNMNLIRELCDHVIVMDSGKLLTEGKPNEVLERKDVMEAYLGE